MFENPQKANKVPTVEYKRVNLVLYVGFVFSVYGLETTDSNIRFLYFMYAWKVQ